MSQQAWCIKGPDGSYDLRTISFTEDGAWLVWSMRHFQQERKQGHTAVLVTVTENAAGRENPVSRQVASDSCIGGVVSDSSPSVNSPAAAAPDALANTFAHWYDKTFPVRHEDTHHFNDCEEAFMAGVALRQQRGEVPLSEKVRRILVESESWKDNRDVESPAAGWMLKVPQKLFIRMISTLKERTE